MLPFLFLFAVLVGVVPANGGNVQYATVYCSIGKCTLISDVFDKVHSTAYGMYNDSIFENGWGHLDIKAGFGSNSTDHDVMYAAGMLEGALTAKRIYENFLNLRYPFFDSQPESAVAFARSFLKEQDKWTREMVNKSSATDAFWRQVGHVNSQLDGLYYGYNSMVNESERLDFFYLQALSASGDLSDIMTASNISGIPDWRKMTRSEVDRYLLMSSRCSAIVKVTDSLDNILMGHSTWFLYQGMTRIYKFWTFKLQDDSVKVKSMSFSSYPGFLVSIDDFYIMSDTSMVMLQTTNGIFNNSLYGLIKPNSLLAWQRVRVANMGASSGKEWAAMFGRYNSGTYPNQYMLIDLKRFNPNVSLDDGLLWVVEQIPGLVESGDQTAILREGYWPSYNIPFFETIYNKSGYPEFVSTHGPNYSYQMAPRAKIFRRDHGKVHDLNSIQNQLRYNDYPNDKFSEDNPCYTICCRGDLVQPVPVAGGCIDTKVTDYHLARNCSASIINGPTRGNNFPEFQWEKSPFKNVSHVGMPEKYDFDFINVKSVL